MKRVNCFLTGLLLLISAIGFAQNQEAAKDDNILFAENVFHLSEIMLHDVANPPAASRFYAYSLLAAYEVAFGGKGKQAPLNNLFKEKLQISGCSKTKEYTHIICSHLCHARCGQADHAIRVFTGEGAKKAR